MYDVIIIGGGPSGLSAAMTLGRACRTTLMCDEGLGRNRTVRNSHGFLTRDGLPPADLRRIGREQLAPYEFVTVREQAVAAAERTGDHFTVRLADGTEEQARRILLGTGMTDLLPKTPGLAEIWGVSAFNCPYCDGYETRGRRVVVLGGSEHSLRLALQISRLAGELVLCTDTEDIADKGMLMLLRSRGVTVRDESVARLESDEGLVQRVVFADGGDLPCDMIFLRPPTRQSSPLAGSLGCEFFEDGSVRVNDYQQTTVRGVFAAGDMARREALPFPAAQIVHASSTGALAAVVMDRELLGEEVQRAREAAAAVG